MSSFRLPSPLQTRRIRASGRSRSSSPRNTLPGNGIRTLTPSKYAPVSLTIGSRPIITFIIILLLPSILTFLTLLVHRVRAARAAQRDRAPEDIVHNLPWQVWTGKGWEKHEGTYAPAKDISPPPDLERGIADPEDTRASTSRPPAIHPHQWFEDQAECAICLSEFAKGDKVRVLPCHHIFHLDEVDEWLIQRKKLVSIFLTSYVPFTGLMCSSVLFAKRMLLRRPTRRQSLQQRLPRREHHYSIPLIPIHTTRRHNT